MASLFKSAKVVEAPKAASKKSDKEEVSIVGLEQLAEIDALIKALSGIKSSLESDVKSQAFTYFFNEAQATAKRPANFKGFEGIATASIEMRKRSTASALSEDEIAMFEGHGLKVEKVIAVQKLFGINPTYATDDALLEKVSTALDGIVPEDFIVVQEERSKSVVGDETIERAFAIKAPREVIEAVTVMAVKCSLINTDIAEIIDNVRTLFERDE